MKKNFLILLLGSVLFRHKVQGNSAMAKRTIFLVKNSAPKLQCRDDSIDEEDYENNMPE